MMKFLIILLDATCPSYCAYENSKAQMFCGKDFIMH